MKKRVGSYTCGLLCLGLAVIPATFTTGCASHNYRSSQNYINDRTLAARVKSDLLRDPVLQWADVDVGAYQQEIQLSGFVSTQDEKTRAGRIAASEPGVMAVHNDLVVRTGR